MGKSNNKTNKKNKIIIRVVIVLFIVFVIYTLFWFAYRHFRYKDFLEVAENPVTIDKYTYATFPPDFLSFRGDLSITPGVRFDGETGERIMDGLYVDMVIFPKVFGGYEIMVSIMDDNSGRLPNNIEAMTLYFSESMELMDSGYSFVLTEEENPDEYAVYEECYEEIADLFTAAHEVFGILGVK